MLRELYGSGVEKLRMEHMTFTVSETVHQYNYYNELCYVINEELGNDIVPLNYTNHILYASNVCSRASAEKFSNPVDVIYKTTYSV